MTRRRLTLIPVLGALAAIAAGCFSYIKEDSAEQVDALNPVRVSTTVCPSMLGFFGDIVSREARSGVAREIFSDDPNDCVTHDEIYELVYESSGEFALPRQLLLAYRVPDGAEAPSVIGADVDVLRLEDVFESVYTKSGDPRVHDDVEWVADPVEQHLTFRKAPELADSMSKFYDFQFDMHDMDETLVGDGDTLVTYVSDVVPGVITDEFDIQADFGLPFNEDGTPFAGPFEHETLMGMRLAMDELFLPDRAASALRAKARADDSDWPFDPNRPVVCPDPDGDIIDEGFTLCPLPHFSDGAMDFAEVLDGVDTATRDLRVAGGAPVTVEQGQTATVPFTIKTAGEASDRAIDLGADVSIQDAKATPRDATWPFQATGEYEQPVTVEVPHYAQPGEYVVRLVASAGAASRDGIATLIVTAKPVQQEQSSPPPPPRTPDNLYLRGGGVPFGYICLVTPQQCAQSYAEMWIDPSVFGPRAVAAQATEAGGLVKVGTRKFRAKKGKRVEAKVRLGKRARRALKRGRTLKGRLIIRSGGKTAPAVQTRGVVIRVKRKK